MVSAELKLNTLVNEITHFLAMDMTKAGVWIRIFTAARGYGSNRPAG